MSGITLGYISGTQEQRKRTTPASLAVRSGLFVVILICSFAVFLLGPNYSSLFPTNGSRLYTGVVCAVFLIAAVFMKRSQKLAPYGPVATAFFVASSVNLLSSLFAGYNGEFLQGFGAEAGTNKGQALGKLYESLLVVLPILVLTKLAGGDLGSLFLKKGNLNYKWGLGIGFLVLFNFLTSALIFYGGGYQVSQLGPVILWGAVFSFSNSMLEELWVRGLFLKKVAPLIGAAGAVVASSIWFGAMHFLNIAFLPAAVVPIMVANTLTLGLACALLTLKTDSIWGAYLIHAAADLFLFIAILAVH